MRSLDKKDMDMDLAVKQPQMQAQQQPQLQKQYVPIERVDAEEAAEAADVVLVRDECERLHVELGRALQNDRDNEMMLEERSVENDMLKEQLDHVRQEIEQARASFECERMVMDTQLQTCRTENEANKREAERHVHYLRARLEQERQLNRQLLEQLEVFKSRAVPVVDEDLGANGVGANASREGREGREDASASTNGVDEADISEAPSIIGAPCIVCTEKHQYYVPIPCNHPICNECYVQWYASRMHYNDTLLEGEHPVIFACPLCRTPIDVTL